MQQENKTCLYFSTMKQTALFCMILLCNLHQVTAQRTLVFVGSYNWDAQKEGIGVYQLDTAAGQLTKVAGIKGVRNPSFLTLSGDGKFLYACTDSKTANAGSVSSFAVNDTSLTFLNKQSSCGENPVYVSVHKSGKWLVNANYTAGTMSVYRILPQGQLDTAVQTISYSGNSINKERQDHAHIHSSVFSPDGRYLFLTDLGTDKIYYYPFDASKNKPLQQAGRKIVNTVPGSGPRHLTFHPNGKMAYCVEELAGYVSVYRLKNGKLDCIQRTAAHNASITTGFESADIHISPDGKFLYASNRGKENNIAIFSIQPDGRIRLLACEPTGGDYPRTFAIDPSGKFVIVTNVITGTVNLLRRDLETGLLTNTGQPSYMPNVSTVQIRSY